MSTSGSSTVAFATAYSMIRSANPCLEIAEACDEVVVEVGLDLLAELLELGAEVGRLAGETFLGIVVREGDFELGSVADLQPDEVRLEPGDESFLPEDQRHPLRGATLEGLAVHRPDERDDRVVTVPGSTVLDRG
jgi:hypothetical protein